jgi:ubiquinone/menaquinone biosynthesis C-methylase UbiE
MDKELFPSSPASVWNDVWSGITEKGHYGFSLYRCDQAVDKVTYMIRAGVEFHDGEKVLDAGCGDGKVLINLLKLYNIEAHGVDFSEAARASSLAAMEKSGKSFQFRLADVRSTSYPENYFDKILSMGVIEHFDPVPALAEFYRILKPQGLLIIMTPNRLSLGKWERVFRQTTGTWEFGYQTEYTPEELSKLCYNAGLTIINGGVELRKRNVNQSLNLKMITTIDQVINSFWPKWGFYSYVFAAKEGKPHQ